MYSKEAVYESDVCKQPFSIGGCSESKRAVMEGLSYTTDVFVD